MEIIFDQVSYAYPGGAGEHRALREMNVSVPSGQYVALMGPNGGGKSTAAQMINGLLLPDSGEVRVGGFRVHKKAKNLRPLRRAVGFLFQNPKHQLFGETVLRDVCFGPVLFGIPDAEARARDAMEQVGLDVERFADASPHRLSGGLMRRAALAGILATGPDVLVLDEATAGLDPQSRREILALVKRLNRERGITVVHVTHRMEEALEADRIVVVKRGEVGADVLTAGGQAGELAATLRVALPPHLRFAQKMEELTGEKGWGALRDERQVAEFLGGQIGKWRKGTDPLW